MSQAATPSISSFLRPVADEPGAAADISPIDRVLDAVRGHLGMEIAFASRIEDGMRQFTHIRADCPVPVVPGDAEPLAETLCGLVLQGELPALMHDARAFPAAVPIGITLGLPVASHVNVPLRLRDGSLYGTFCCVNRTPDWSLTDRDTATLRAFADLAVQLIEGDLAQQNREKVVTARVKAVLEFDAITIVHQPIHELVSGRPVGVESLARFPDAGRRGPDAWFAEAAEVGLGTALELTAIRAALRTLGHVPARCYLSINASPATIISGELLDAVRDHDRTRLVIEVTEHSQVEDYAVLAAALDRLRPHARIAIDDVGAGYAGLRHLVDLRPDILKLDMSLTRDIARDPARRALAHALVHFAAEMGCVIVAEGIETEAERATLAQLKVQLAQGYLFNRPMPVVAAQQVLLELDRTPQPITLAVPDVRLRATG